MGVDEEALAFRQVRERAGTMMAAPVWESLSYAAQTEFTQRLLTDVTWWEDLSESDRDLVRRGELEVSVGLSRTLRDTSEWGDPVAIDAGVDAADDSGDTSLLDAALFTVGHGYGVREPWAGSAPAQAETKADVDPDGEDWIGL